MINIKYDNEIDKIYRRKELIELLEKYRKVINSWMYDYLVCLMNLEFSVVRNNISSDERDVLSELEIYKKLAIYNIYYKAKNLLQSSDLDIEISGSKKELTAIKRINDERVIKIFSYMIGNDISIPDGFKTMNIGRIDLFQTIENQELREKELIGLKEHFDNESKIKNPYPHINDVEGGADAIWDLMQKRKLSRLQEKISKLDSIKELTDAERKELEITSKIYALFLKDYGLTRKDFHKEDKLLNTNIYQENSNLEKVLVKEIPNLTIYSNIRYI